MISRLALPLVLFTAWLAAACGEDGGPPGTLQPPGGTPTIVRVDPPDGFPGIELEVVAFGLDRPTFATGAGDGSGRLFVLEQRGRIRVISGESLSPEPFLDISDRVEAGATERGLLGLAFHPGFGENGRFFVTYTARGGAVVLAEFAVEGDGTVRPDGERRLLGLPHPRRNHNGGMIAFGPDGYLYMGTGDGGGAGDPDRAAQDLASLAGKLLRLDVDAGTAAAYAIPADNPFVGRPNARDEIWASGLRNPWRFSFDRATGDLWLADVGQDEVEEINYHPADQAGGANFGWSVMEGDRCFRGDCDPSRFTAPLYTYTHDDGCSIIGGYVYRGRAVPGLEGAYLFADYCGGWIRALGRDASGRREEATVAAAAGPVASFGEDDGGEVYVLSQESGTVARIVPAR